MDLSVEFRAGTYINYYSLRPDSISCSDFFRVDFCMFGGRYRAILVFRQYFLFTSFDYISCLTQKQLQRSTLKTTLPAKMNGHFYAFREEFGDILSRKFSITLRLYKCRLYLCANSLKALCYPMDFGCPMHTPPLQF